MSVDHAFGPYQNWLNDPEIVKNLEAERCVYTPQDILEYIENTNKSHDQLLLAICVKDTDVHIGNIKIQLCASHKRGSIGIIIGEKECWGQGYASEAISLLSEYSFSDLGLHKITAGCYSRNVGSEKAFLKAGYAVECRRKNHYWIDDEWVDGIFLCRFKSDART